MSKLDQIKVTPNSTAKKTKIASLDAPATIKLAVDAIITSKAKIKDETRILNENESEVITYVREQQDSAARAGQFSKSFIVPGNTGSLTYVSSDRFSVPQNGDELSALKELLGKRYEEFFRERVSLSIKSDVLSNNELIDQILRACEEAGLDLNSIFEKRVVVEAVEDLDMKQYTLPAKKLEVFRTLVRQSKPALK